MTSSRANLILSRELRFHSLRFPAPSSPDRSDKIILPCPSYLTGASKISKPIEECIVFEDAPSGIKSGVASGAKVLAVCTSHTREQVQNYGATWIVDDLTK